MPVFKSCGLRVPPIFKRYARATLLSTWTWMVKSDKYFVEVRIVNFNASNSWTFMWKYFFFYDHFHFVETSLQYAPVILSRHLSEWPYGVPAAGFSSHCKVSSFPSTKGVPPWINYSLSHDHFRIPFSVELIFVFAEDIETRFLLAKRLGQLMAAGQLTLWDLGLKFLAAWKSPEIVETHALIFSLMERKVVFFVSIVKPRNSICFTGWRTDFSRLIIKLKCCIRKINVSRHENFL